MSPDRVVPSPAARAGSTVRLDRLARIELRDDGDRVFVTITGEIDISNVDELSGALGGLPNAMSVLIVDLTAVGYLDSAGISLLHATADRLEHRSQRLVLVCPPDAPCHRVLDLTGMALRVPLFAGMDPAAASLDSG